MQPKFEKRALRVLADCSDTNSVPKPLKSVAFSPDAGYIAWFTGQRELVLTKWDSIKNAPVTSEAKILLPHEEDTIWTMVFGKAGREPVAHEGGRRKNSKGGFVRFEDEHELFLVAGTKAGRIKVWSVATGKLYFELTDHRDKITSLCLNPNNSRVLLSSSCDGTLKLWDLADDGNMFKTLKNTPVSPQLTCAWSGCGTLIASGGRDRTITVWRRDNWTVSYHLDGHMHAVTKIKFLPDSSFLVSASLDSTVVVWNPWNGTRIRTLWHMLPKPSPIIAFGGNEHEVWDLSVAPDSVHIATVCQDGVLRVWDIREMQPLDSCRVNHISHCEYAPDGNSIAIGSRSGKREVVSSSMQVHSLKHLCMVTIRKTTSREHVHKLQLPPTVKHSLLNPPITNRDNTHNFQF